jgi:F-type H+-transporting ATPase subunit b
MEIFEQFGFDLKLFAAQIVNFLVIAFIFKKFLYKPILDTLQKRKAAIKKGLKDAEDASLALEKAEESKEQILNKASKEAESIIAEARKQAQDARDSMMAETKADLDKMMESTKAQIALEREDFKKEARDVSLEISRQILESVLVDLFDKKDKDILLNKGLSKIKNDKHTKN